MSLVGTRPILQDELLKYELHHRARIAIKPGITGMWQVSGRSDITDFEEVVRLDTEYISKALFTKHPYSMYELKICRDYRDGKVTKEDLDKCSTCDMNCVINNGLSEASKEQLKHKTGEEIVDADIAQQMETK